MKQILTFILIFSFSISFGQNNAIEKANKLIKEKKYESAIKVLNDADPNNDNPEIVIAKTDIYINYFVTSFMHQLFALKDLEEDEEVMDIRGSNGSFSMFLFAPDSILLRLIDKYPENYELRKSLGSFYHEIHLKYPQNWLQADSLVVKNFFDNYKIAYEHGVCDYWSTYGIGYAYLTKSDYKNAIPYLEKSIELKNDYSSSHYNLAYAYLYTDQREKGIESAKKAVDLYDYPQYKADALRLIAISYQELNELEKSRDYYIQVDSVYPNDYYTLKPLLDLELSLGKKNYIDRAQQFFLIAPGNPTIYQDLIRMYRNHDKQKELINFFEGQHENYLDNNKVNANLYFYSAIIQYDNEDFENAKINFKKAKKIFKKVYKSNHRVFDAIDSYMKEL